MIVFITLFGLQYELESNWIPYIYEKSDILAQSSVMSKNEEAVNSSLMSKARSS